MLKTIDALARSEAKRGGESLADYSSIMVFVWPVAEKAWSDDAMLPRFNMCRQSFVASYVAGDGCKAVSAKDVKAGKGSQHDADKYARTQARARSTFGMGTKRALDARGIERPTKKRGTAASATEAAQTTAAGATGFDIPPSFLADLHAVHDAVGEFMVRFGAKLSKPGKDRIGVIGEMIGRLIADVEKPAVPAVPNLGAALDAASAPATVQ